MFQNGPSVDDGKKREATITTTTTTAELAAPETAATTTTTAELTAPETAAAAKCIQNIDVNVECSGPNGC